MLPLERYTPDQHDRLLASISRPGCPSLTPLACGRDIKATLFAAEDPPENLDICFQSRHHTELFRCPFELIASGNAHYVEKGTTHVVRVFEHDPKFYSGDPLSLPVRVLIVVASPHDLAGKLDTIDYTQVERDTKSALGSCYGTDAEEHPISRVTILHGSDTLGQLELLSQSRPNQGYNIVEIIAHGHQNDRGGMLVLVDDDGSPIDVAGGTLFQRIPGLPTKKPRLVLVNSCRSGGGIGSGHGQYSNIAWQLLDNEAPAVIAMQEDVPISEALAARKALYQCLFRGETLRNCVHGMRKPLNDLWYAPILAVQADFEPTIFSEPASKQLKLLSKANEEVNNLYNAYDKLHTDDTLKKLVVYLQQFPFDQLRLLDKRERIADALVEDVTRRLNVRL